MCLLTFWPTDATCSLKIITKPYCMVQEMHLLSGTCNVCSEVSNMKLYREWQIQYCSTTTFCFSNLQNKVRLPLKGKIQFTLYLSCQDATYFVCLIDLRKWLTGKQKKVNIPVKVCLFFGLSLYGKHGNHARP